MTATSTIAASIASERRDCLAKMYSEVFHSGPDGMVLVQLQLDGASARVRVVPPNGKAVEIVMQARSADRRRRRPRFGVVRGVADGDRLRRREGPDGRLPREGQREGALRRDVRASRPCPLSPRSPLRRAAWCRDLRARRDTVTRRPTVLSMTLRITQVTTTA